MNSYNSPFKFNAKELDEETGNYYYGARYYDPKWSIMLSVDQMSEKYPSFSPYAYTLQNPVRFTDPTGMTAEEGKAVQDFDDIIYVGNDGKVSRVEETDDDFNVFVMEDNSEVLHLNDSEGLDKSMYTNDNFKKGDRVFFPISDEELQGALDDVGEGSWYNLAWKSHGDADFTMSYLVENYFGRDDTGQEKAYLEDGTLRTHYKENFHYFRFGNDSDILNLYDAGNSMWGSWMNYSGYDYSTAQFGSQFNEAFGDSDADQRAIRSGYFYYERIKQ